MIKLPGSAARIVPATWRDLTTLRKIESLCFPKDSWPMLDLVGVLMIPGVVRLKAVIEEEMIGFIAGDIKEAGKLAWIATVCVHPKYQRLGIGHGLIQACEEMVKVKRMRLSVRSTNQAAIELYKRMDYYQVGIWERYYDDGGDALVMEKKLTL